jgi:hypothetical protein
MQTRHVHAKGKFTLAQEVYELQGPSIDRKMSGTLVGAGLASLNAACYYNISLLKREHTTLLVG